MSPKRPTPAAPSRKAPQTVTARRRKLRAAPYAVQAALPGLGLLDTPAVEAAGVMTRSSARATSLLQGDLTKLPIPPTSEKLPVKEVAGLVVVRPLVLLPLKLAGSVQGLQKIASRDPLRPALTGAFLDVKNQLVVATNGHALVVVPDASLTGKDRVVNLDNGSIIQDRYPEYENVIPIKRTLFGEVANLAGLRGQLAGIVRASKFVNFGKELGIRAEIRYGERYYYFDAQLLLQVLEALMSTGSQALRLEFDSSNTRALLLRDGTNQKKLAIVMPLTNYDVYQTPLPGRSEVMPFCPVLAFEGKAAPKEAGAPAPAAEGQPLPKKKVVVMPEPTPAPKKPKSATTAKPRAFKKGDKVRVLWTGRGEIATLTYKDKNGWNYTYAGGKKGTGMKPDQMELFMEPEAKPVSKPVPLDYFNAKGQPITDLTGKIDPKKLYYVQPDGSYEQGGDRRSPGWVKPPKTKAPKAKAARPKKAPAAKAAPQPKAAKAAPKAKPADPREQVPHLEADVLLMQAFLRLVEHPVTVDQVRNLHRRLEKSIGQQRVRLRSQHAVVVQDMADVVGKTYERMSEAGIGRVEKLEITNPVVGRARRVVDGVRVAASMNLLSKFINMQGQVPEKKAVESLIKQLAANHAEHPKSDYALAVGAAEAVLRDWQPGRLVKISVAQLNGLSGLGCPDRPGLACGCDAKKAGR